MATDYKKRLKIPIKETKKKLYTESKVLVAKSYRRIVLGKRGPYVEFKKGDLMMEGFVIPASEVWRCHSVNAFYHEYRSVPDNVKMYYQKHLVEYADYKRGFYYISPFDLYFKKSGELVVCIKKLK